MAKRRKGRPRTSALDSRVYDVSIVVRVEGFDREQAIERATSLVHVGAWLIQRITTRRVPPPCI
jgi:hypothetical protein